MRDVLINLSLALIIAIELILLSTITPICLKIVNIIHNNITADALLSFVTTSIIGSVTCIISFTSYKLSKNNFYYKNKKEKESRLNSEKYAYKQINYWLETSFGAIESTHNNFDIINASSLSQLEPVIHTISIINKYTPTFDFLSTSNLSSKCQDIIIQAQAIHGLINTIPDSYQIINQFEYNDIKHKENAIKEILVKTTTDIRKKKSDLLCTLQHELIKSQAHK